MPAPVVLLRHHVASARRDLGSATYR